MMNVNNLINNLPFVMQNSYGAAIAVVAANVLITEVAIRISILGCKIFDSYLDFSKDVVVVVWVLTTISASIVGMNIALNKLLKFPFNPWVTAGLCTLTAVSYAAIRIK